MIRKTASITSRITIKVNINSLISLELIAGVDPVPDYRYTGTSFRISGDTYREI